MGVLAKLLVAALVPAASAWSTPSHLKWGGGNNRGNSGVSSDNHRGNSGASSENYRGNAGASSDNHRGNSEVSYTNNTSSKPAVSQERPNSYWNNSTLSQSQTNGHSTWGTSAHENLAPFLNGPMPGGANKPWGHRLANDTNPYDMSQVPNTGVTRSYSWTVTNTTIAPDGVDWVGLVVNGQFPGPLIEANWGDWIEVTVHNELYEGTAIHWHGFLQTGTPYMDGVPGISQCPIAPGSSFTYRFRAELYGTSWWHGHLSAQYIQGLVGPIVIHGPKSESYDVDLGPVMLTDIFHGYYQDLVAQIYFSSDVGPVFPPMANNMLIQGKASYDCNNTVKACTPGAKKAEFKFQSGKKHLLRLINHSAEAVIFFSIDGYEMTVIANDFVPVVPYTTGLVTLGVGQRMDVVVQGGNSSTEAVWMRITEGPSGLGPKGATGCSLNDGKSIGMEAAIYYEDADTSIPPNTTDKIAPSRLLFPVACSNDPLNMTVPAFAIGIKEPTVTLRYTMTGGKNGTGAFVWYMNNQTYITDWNDPTLLEAKLGNLEFDPMRRVIDLGTNTTVRIIMESVGFPASHPMHIHGHNFQVLAEGFGKWDNTTIINPSNPQRRDTFLVKPAGYAVVQFDLDNPGVWAFHCHIAWHVSQGMNVVFLEQTPTFQEKTEIPYVMAQTCRDWASYSGNNVVDMIDSGL